MKALLVVDVQRGLFGVGELAIHKEEDLIAKINSLLAKAREAKALIIFVQHHEVEGSLLEKDTEGWQLHEGVNCETDHDLFIEKVNGSSFHKPPLNSILKSRGINELVVCGLQSEYCIDAVCRHGFALDYKITLASDAHSTHSSKELDAAQIISHHNRVLRSYADVKASVNIKF